MALVPYVDPADVPDDLSAAFSRPINLLRALVNSPGAFRQFHPFGEWIRWQCELDPRQRELLILAVGYLACSPYEYSHHIALSAQFGVTDADIAALVDHLEGHPSDLGDQERLLIDAARELTEDRRLSDRTAAALGAHYNDSRLVDIVVVASFYNMVVRVLGGLRIDNEPEYDGHLDRFPLTNGARGVG
ncbi:carboxymuconolactone decarboxylase family protein [Microbacterium sp. NPDC078428]|uniref:carboxymuconolactone decarboxylase family protein n=1 Tax=Microbacterium sp. NPDC078428 TaxID=3364190 RepID=UPI0037CB783B